MEGYRKWEGRKRGISTKTDMLYKLLFWALACTLWKANGENLSERLACVVIVFVCALRFYRRWWFSAAVVVQAKKNSLIALLLFPNATWMVLPGLNFFFALYLILLSLFIASLWRKEGRGRPLSKYLSVIILSNGVKCLMKSSHVIHE